MSTVTLSRGAGRLVEILVYVGSSSCFHLGHGICLAVYRRMCYGELGTDNPTSSYYFGRILEFVAGVRIFSFEERF